MERIPWIEKYRPKEFDSIILDETNRIILKNSLEKNMIPNLIFYGPPGTGKTTTIINYINEYQKKNNQEHKELVIHLNASDDRGIEIIRNQIYMFSNSMHLFNRGTKFIILDEIDYMTKNAQFLLYTLMKEQKENVRFCLICNYISKLDKSLQNMCMTFKFNTLPRENIFYFMKKICDGEKINNVNDNDIHNIIKKFGSDIRSMINYLQRVSLKQGNTGLMVISDDNIKELVDYFISNTVSKSEKKINNYMYEYNIEKQELIVHIFRYVTDNYDITGRLISFMKSIFHNNNYYLDEFNKFFISNLVSLLK